MDLIKVENNIAILDPEIIENIVEIEKAVKNAKEVEDSLKQMIFDEMQAKGILKIDAEELLINYIEETDVEKFDSKAFKKEHQDLYDDYVKMSKRKAYITLKVKE